MPWANDERGNPMKKTLYAAVLLVEAAAGFFAMCALNAYLGLEACVVVLTVWVLLMAWQIILLAKAEDAETGQKIRKRIQLVMLVPVLDCIIGILAVVVAFVNAFI